MSNYYTKIQSQASSLLQASQSSITQSNKALKQRLVSVQIQPSQFSVNGSIAAGNAGYLIDRQSKQQKINNTLVDQNSSTKKLQRADELQNKLLGSRKVQINQLKAKGDSSSKMLNSARTPPKYLIYANDLRHSSPFQNQKIAENIENELSFSQNKRINSKRSSQLQQSMSTKELQHSFLNVSKQQSKSSQDIAAVKYLTDKIATLIEEINKLTETIDKLLSENEKLKTKYRRVKQLYVNKVTEQNNYQQTEKFKDLISGYQQEIKDLKDQQDQLKSQKSSYYQEKQKLIETIEIYQEEAINWKEKCDSLVGTCEEYTQTIKQQQLEILELKEQKKQIEYELPKNSQEKENFEQQIQEDNQQINDLQEEIKEYEMQFNQLSEQNEELQHELNEKNLQIQEGSKTYEEKILQLQKQFNDQQMQSLSVQTKQIENKKGLVEQNTLIQYHLDEMGKKNQILSEQNQQLEELIKAYEYQLSHQKSSEPQTSRKESASQHLISSSSDKSTPVLTESDDYLVRQLRKFQELQKQTSQQPNQLGSKNSSKRQNSIGTLNKKGTKNITKKQFKKQ